jgi:hypothetical protein
MLLYWLDLVDGTRSLPEALYVFGRVEDGSSCCLRMRAPSRVFYAIVRPDCDPEVAREELTSIYLRHGFRNITTKTLNRNNLFYPNEARCGVIPFVRVETRDWLSTLPTTARTGTAFSKLLGTDTTIIERVILKCQLQGPGWLKIDDRACTNVSTDRITTTSVEVIVDDESCLKHVHDMTRPILRQLAIAFDGPNVFTLAYEDQVRSSLSADEAARVVQIYDPDVVIGHRITERRASWLDRFRTGHRGGRITCDTRRVAREHMQKQYDIPIDASGSLSLIARLGALELATKLAHYSGYTLNGCLNDRRSKRVEFALLHAFHDRNFVLPEPVVGWMHSKKASRPYVGGLVLTPVVGLHEWVLVLDFKSMYPSIIMANDLSFASVLNRTNVSDGVLPHVLRHYVHARRRIKEALTTETDPIAIDALNVKQTALKLLANATYGCLGYVGFRFCCKALAERITRLGREKLQETADAALALLPRECRIVAGDTDSIMINVAGVVADHQKAAELGRRLATEINQRQPSNVLEIELADVFSRMLVVSKKKYAGISAKNDCRIVRGLEMVRHDWAPIARDISSRILDVILSTDDVRDTLAPCCELLKEMIGAMRTRPLDDFVIVKELSRPLQRYDTNSRGMYHVIAARALHGNPLGIHDLVRYVMLETERPYCVEMLTAETTHELDLEYYKFKQILPPVMRILRATNVEATDAVQFALDPERRLYTTSAPIVIRASFLFRG